MTNKKIGRPAERPETRSQRRLQDFCRDTSISDALEQDRRREQEHDEAIYAEMRRLHAEFYRKHDEERERKRLAGEFDQEVATEALFRSGRRGIIAMWNCANLVFWHSLLQEAILSVYARAVLTDLAMRDNGKDGGHAFAGVRKIANSCGISQTLVIRSIRELEVAGLIEVKRESRKRSHYRVRSLEEWQQWKGKSAPSHGAVGGKKYEKLLHSVEQPAPPRGADLLHDVERKEIPRDLIKEIGSADAQKSLFSKTDSSKPAKRKFDQLPSLSEIIDYCAKLDLPETDALDMRDRWLENGFTRGSGKPVKDWQAAVRNWKRRGWLLSQKQQKSQTDPFKL